MTYVISKKKKDEFNKIFFFIDDNNILLNIELFRKLFESDYYLYFLEYIKKKIDEIICHNYNGYFYLHINIATFVISDLYYYDKILLFAKILHEYTNKLISIYIYESSYIFTNLINMINNSLSFEVDKKIIFENKENFNSKFNKIYVCM